MTKKFIEGRPNDRIGLIAFASRPYLVSPLTLDHDWLLQNLDRVHIGQVEDGTAIGSAIASGLNRLKDPSSKSKVLILLTDGVNNCGKVTPETAAEASKALGIRLYAIGAGTNGIAPVPVYEREHGDAAARSGREADVHRRAGVLRRGAAEAGGANRGRPLLPGIGYEIDAGYFLGDRQAGEIDGEV